ncbi:MAG: hypothetical protein EBZ05_02305 [Verrucomicrobia bacterium]|nr:hypothetical protein [Verrucomicrobiota bacterium]
MNSLLAQQLAARIQHSGPISFATFMEEALYHPEHGFYVSGSARTGQSGDFLTPVSPGPVLGQLLARQADELHRILGCPKKLRLIEQGADTGWLARDLLASIAHDHPALATAAELHLLEPHPKLEQKQRETLLAAGFGHQTRWHKNWEAVPTDDSPCFFYSCELVDSFPVQIFRYRRGNWREMRVGLGDGRLIWQEDGVDPESSAKIRRWAAPEVEGFTVELRPGTARWAELWTQKIPLGLGLTLDYGFPAQELFAPHRTGGTLRALRHHQLAADPLEKPGEQDLTAHVNFTELEELGALAGWTSYGLTDFARGLTALATPLLQKESQPTKPWVRNFRHLTHPSFFGQTHKILVQGKGLPVAFQPAVRGER